MRSFVVEFLKKDFSFLKEKDIKFSHLQQTNLNIISQFS